MRRGGVLGQPARGRAGRLGARGRGRARLRAPPGRGAQARGRRPRGARGERGPLAEPAARRPLPRPARGGRRRRGAGARAAPLRGPHPRPRGARGGRLRGVGQGGRLLGARRLHAPRPLGRRLGPRAGRPGGRLRRLRAGAPALRHGRAPGERHGRARRRGLGRDAPRLRRGAAGRRRRARPPGDRRRGGPGARGTPPPSTSTSRTLAARPGAPGTWRAREGVFSYSSVHALLDADAAPRALPTREEREAEAAGAPATEDADRATNLGSAFHELAQAMVESGRAADEARVTAQVRRWNLSPRAAATPARGARALGGVEYPRRGALVAARARRGPVLPAGGVRLRRAPRGGHRPSLHGRRGAPRARRRLQDRRRRPLARRGSRASCHAGGVLRGGPAPRGLRAGDVRLRLRGARRPGQPPASPSWLATSSAAGEAAPPLGGGEA